MSSVRDATRGVGPVIGVVLMVAIVVVLGTVIGAYFVSFSEQEPTQAPQVAIVADYSQRTGGNGEYLNLSFESGDTIERDDLSLVMRDARSSGGGAATLTGDPVQAQAPTRITAGTEVSIHAGQFSGVGTGEHLDLGEATLRLVWQTDAHEETETYVIYRWPAPSQR
ncbi:type IV pilin N-terminal domain-containing protein [Halomicroarcula sp. GCM10025324]|uniref:type IV pilin N-terminal domain-containing protein n=1 Tax=Haloarcula TaxID=2237 RepID=UPI0023E7D77D|nr:type IV pilin N-terminal domain-containing protein [Halomicroarcula sp. ZS-22-S1]